MKQTIPPVKIKFGDNNKYIYITDTYKELLQNINDSKIFGGLIPKYNLKYKLNKKLPDIEINNQEDYNKFKKEFNNNKKLYIILDIIKEKEEDKKNYITKLFNEKMNNYKQDIINIFLKDYSYMVNEKNIIFYLDNNINNNFFEKKIILTNNGLMDWNVGYVFKFLSESDIEGNDININIILKKNDSIDIKLCFKNLNFTEIKYDIEYKVYYQMYKDNDEKFGNITEFKVIFKK